VRLAAATSLFALAGSACSGCSTNSSAPISDAAADGVAESSREASIGDAGAGEAPLADAFVADAGFVFDGNVPDGAINPFGSGQWSTIPGLPCLDPVAADPNASVPALTWMPCASGRSGCQRFDVNWPSPTQRKLGFDRWETVRMVNGQALLRDWRVYSNSPYTAQAGMFVVETLTGTRLFAMGFFADTTACLAVQTIGERGIAMGLAGGVLPNITYYMVSSAWRDPNMLTFRAHAPADFGLDPQVGALNQGSVGAGPLFLELQGPDSVGIYDIDHDKFIPTSPKLVGEGTMAVTDGALAFDFNSTYGVDLIHPDGSWANVIVPSAPAPRRVSAFGIDRSSGQQLTWVESDYGGSWSNSVIWTSPYATSTAGLAPRKVAVLADVLGRGGLYMPVNAGAVLNLVDKDKALVTRLSDGMGWLITAEPGDAFTQPLWVDDNEVWIAIGPASDPSWTATLTGIVRFTRASLGAPTVMPGL
jgi:hypothetical protein